MRISLAILLAVIFVTPCAASALDARIQVTCQNVDRNISMLEREKGYNAMRVNDGVNNVYPPTVAYRLVEGTNDDRFEMPAREWKAKLDGRIASLQAFKEECQSYKYSGE